MLENLLLLLADTEQSRQPRLADVILVLYRGGMSWPAVLALLETAVNGHLVELAFDGNVMLTEYGRDVVRSSTMSVV